MHEFRDFAVKSLCDTIKPLVRDGSVAPGLGPIVDQIAVIIHQLYLLDIIKVRSPACMPSPISNAHGLPPTDLVLSSFLAKAWT